MTDENSRTESEDGEVSETNNLRQSDADDGLQTGDGVPPGSEAAQENQSRIEAEISSDDPHAEGPDDAVDRAVGRDHA